MIRRWLVFSEFCLLLTPYLVVSSLQIVRPKIPSPFESMDDVDKNSSIGFRVPSFMNGKIGVGREGKKFWGRNVKIATIAPLHEPKECIPAINNLPFKVFNNILLKFSNVMPRGFVAVMITATRNLVR